ncbi:MAG: DEAD/DEAH box helicase [Syntrophaceae bacterium]|mgnify:FL=1|nr:DEAD/DEAH box helicase [Syntrophaceae bacterium]
MTFPALSLNPSGHLVYHPGVDNAALSAEVAARLEQAFSGHGQAGLLHLATVELETPLPSLFSFWRNFARLYLTKLCQSAGLEAQKLMAVPPPVREELERLADTCPPMQGFEYLNADALAALWEGLDQHTQSEIKQDTGEVQSFLKKRNPLWNMVGKVIFHLAENRRNEERPFAFLVTYTTRLSGMAKPQHLPLGKALAEFSGQKDRQGLLNLLTPLKRAAQQSNLIGSLVESGEIFHPVAWTPSETHRFLKDIPLIESSGILVRIPDWWRAQGGRPARPKVSVSLGGRKGQGLGLDALMDFSVQLSLDGEELTREEWRLIQESSSGLVQIRGKWVEVDRDKLADVLATWEKMAHEDFRQGISLARGMQILSGAGILPKDAQAFEDDRREWLDVRAGKWLAKILAELRSPEKVADAHPGDLLKTPLRPYQQTGVNWLWFMNRLGIGACLADDMGLGKTIQILALLLLLQKEKRSSQSIPAPSLLVVPASLLANWKQEILRFAPSLSVFLAHTSETPAAELAKLAHPQDRAARLNGKDLIITTYSLLQRQSWFEKETWSLIILDEAQAIKNPSTRQTRAVKALSGKNRIILSGTPVENRLGDLWSLFDFLSPGLLGSSTVFSRYVKQSSENGDQSYAGLRSLVRPYILRRMKTDKRIIADLPDKVEVRAFCPLTKIQAALYEQSVQELARQLQEAEDGIARRGLVLSYLMRFKQICNHPSHWLGDQDYDQNKSGKFRRLKEICEEIAAKQEKVLIFSQFREITAPLSEALADVFGQPGLILTGETPVKKRLELINSFQREEGPPFFVLSLKAGGVGLNLTAASHVIHFDRWWNPAVENQATDRAYRIGQHKNILVHKFVCRGTVEEKIDALIEEKKELAESILGQGAERLLTEMPDDELLNFVSLDLSRALDS